MIEYQKKQNDKNLYNKCLEEINLMMNDLKDENSPIVSEIDEKEIPEV